MAKTMSARLFLPVAEATSMAHVMLQTVRGLLTGKQGPWTRHILSGKREDGSPVELAYFTRLEFQDGTRKKATQGYHGSGRPHMHVLLWCDEEERLPLPEILHASTEGEDEDFKGVVLGVQKGATAESGRDVYNGESKWDEDTHTWKLHHTKEDQAAAIRTYFASIMDCLRCHQDTAICDHRGALRAYVAKYVSKFSDSASEEWLNDFSEACHVAANVLYRYKPYEPEMVLQLFGAHFRQWDASTATRGKRDIYTPVPDQEDMPTFVNHYMECSWKGEDMPLIEFLRKTNSDGNIARWLKKKHKDSGSDIPLEAYARTYTVRGGALVAADMTRWTQDRFYGQWLMLHVPFKKPSELLPKSIRKLVPEHLKYLACALHNPHPTARNVWASAGAIEDEMELEGHAPSFKQTVLAMIAANRSMISDYIEGRLKKTSADDKIDDPGEIQTDAPSTEVVLNWAQKSFVDAVSESVDKSMNIKAETDPDEEDELRDKSRMGKAHVLIGPPGTGKTTTAMGCIKHAVEVGGKVLVALPTAQLASRMREQLRDMKGLEVDTCAAAFALLEQSTMCLPTLGKYSLIYIDEISQMNTKDFERVLKLWDHVDKTPALVFSGDKYQMSGYGDERPWGSRMWQRQCKEKYLSRAYRCKDRRFWNMLQGIRTTMPKKALLHDLCRGRKAWGRRPTLIEVRRVLKRHPKTTMMTCTRRAATELNHLAIAAKFPKRAPLVTVPGDPESNPENYVDSKLRQSKTLRPLLVPIYRGMSVYITDNVHKENDYCNGMLAHVEHYCRKSGGIRVRTQTGKRLMIYRWTNPHRPGSKSYYPIRPGYASTIMKFQGAGLEHVTIWLDVPNIKGAAYTALSRVSTAKDYLLGGELRDIHFTPSVG
jgi:hypothetical protein